MELEAAEDWTPDVWWADSDKYPVLRKYLPSKETRERLQVIDQAIVDEHNDY